MTARSRRDPRDRRDRNTHPWDAVVVTHWAQTPDQTRLRSDRDTSRMNWPFAAVVRTATSPLDDAHFEVFVDKVWVLVQDEAGRMPARRRRPFLADQQRRLDRYRDQRTRRAS